MLINPEQDPMGQAISDFYNKRKVFKLLSRTQYTTEEEFPVDYLFRTWKQMPKIEQKALQMAKGKILDVGAAAGAHSLYLQNKGLNVKAIDNSKISVEVMQKRGILNTEVVDFYDMKSEKFDTLLFLMNGVGICGNLEGLPRFLAQCKKLLKEGGQILLDSSDLIYLFTNDDGSVCIDINGAYYGEVVYSMRYRRIKSVPFKWIFIDSEILQRISQENGFSCQIITKGKHFEYLAKLTLSE